MKTKNLARLSSRNACRQPWLLQPQEPQLCPQAGKQQEKWGVGGRGASPLPTLSHRQHFPNARSTCMPQWKVVENSTH